MVELSDDRVPLKRPHFALRQRRLFFLLSTRAYTVLDRVDEALWDRIDGTATIGQLRESIPDVEARVRRLWDLGACELAPSRIPPAGNRRRVLVIEPHMDDAVLSVGGMMWSLRAECEFTLVTVAGRSNYTSYYNLDRQYFDVTRVSALRRAESALVMRLLGGRHIALDELEAPLRFQPGNWTLDWYRRHRKLVDAFIMHCSTAQEIESWAAPIEHLLRAADTEEIWLPLGVGAHTDHELARDACLRALHRLRGLERRAAVFFYQDVPYATQFPLHTDAIVEALTAAGGGLERRHDDISGSLGDKLRLASIFGSQFKPSYIAPRIEEAARRASPSGDDCCELRFRVKTLPHPVDPLAVYSGRIVVERLATRLAPWYHRHRSAPRITVLSPVPVGRWADDLSLLLEVFPQSVFEMHVSQEYVDETTRLASPRIEVRTVFGREWAWLVRLARIAVARSRPLIVLTGEGLRSAAPLTRAAFFLSDPLAVTRMNDLVLALRVVIEKGGPARSGSS